jgi:predicted transcriptional regulator
MDTVLPAVGRLDLMCVAEVMNAPVIGCDPAAPLATLAAVFAAERIHCVVVARVEETPDGERVAWGAIAAIDLMRALDAGDGGATAECLAQQPPVTIEQEESVARAVQLMADNDVTHLVVVAGYRPVGVVSALDVAGAAAAGSLPS